ncbi:UPF0104 family protein [Aquifex aeolicus]|uniref:Integral membrane protein n=1 Tax=Aquifex aeolicus (strain VF5) TaxID=224324 RepID=O66999_AQUAE|nr:UPF0104 family protein [Aquifex aeolicus]AAC06968.1 putative protein [Aquifex aeolicus VF5]
MLKNLIRSVIKGSVLLVFFLLLSFLFLAYRSFSPEALYLVGNLNKFYLLLAFFCLFLVHTFDNARLFIISRALGIKYSFLYGYITSFVNTFGATVTPAHIGGEGMAVYMLLRKGISAHKVATAVTFKTVTGMVFFILCFPFLILQTLKSPKNFINLFLILLVLLLFTPLFFTGIKKFLKKKDSEGLGSKLRKFLVKYLGAVKFFYKRKKAEFLLASLSSIGLYLSFLFIAFFLLLSFGKEVSPLEILSLQLGLLYAIFVSPTPGGSGVGEIGGYVIFAGLLGQNEVGVFVLLWRLISQYFSAFLGGILFFICLLIDTKKYLKVY